MLELLTPPNAVRRVRIYSGVRTCQRAAAYQYIRKLLGTLSRRKALRKQ